MERLAASPRPDWQAAVESQGLLFHTTDREPYWDESHYYRFSAFEIDQLEKASYELNDMCIKAVEHVIANNLFDRFLIPAEFVPYIVDSWESDETTIYGRFDLRFDGRGAPRLLEYNADTPTALLEAAVIQWFWFKDMSRDDPRLDQFNSVHDRLIEAWGSLREQVAGKIWFCSMADHLEDYVTVNYLRDTAIQAGFDTAYMSMEEIGFDAQSSEFVDTDNAPMWNIFKLYPWEWMIHEEFGRQVLLQKTRWFEPPWKMLLSNKAILPVLWELFPGSPYLLRAAYEPFGDTYVKKPILAREGANISIVEYGVTTDRSGGDYSEEHCVYQEYLPLPDFGGVYPVVGSWMVNGYACGVGIREDSTRITRNTSRFVPHVFAKF